MDYFCSTGSNGFKEAFITMFSHMYPPFPLFAHRTTLDSMPIEQFVGKGLVIDCSDLYEVHSITMKYIKNVEDKASHAEFILFNNNL